MTAFVRATQEQQPTIKNTRQVQLEITDIDIHNGKPVIDLKISNRYPYELKCLQHLKQDLFIIRMTPHNTNFEITSKCYAPQSAASFYCRLTVPCDWFGRFVDIQLSSEEERLVGTLKLPTHNEITTLP